MSARTARLVMPLAVGMLVAAGPAQAAGFSCKYARSQVEKLICATPELSKLDDEMKAVYDKVEAETWGVDGETGKVLDPAGIEQKQWREKIRDACQDAACIKRAYVGHLAAWRKQYADILSDGGN